jgi:hypothetical protein
MNTAAADVAATPRAGAGIGQDYTLQTARKVYPCNHREANGWRRMAVACAGDIQPGDLYARSRQSWLDWSPVNLECLVRAGILTVSK